MSIHWEPAEAPAPKPEPAPDIEMAVTQLRCALINCDNIKLLGPVMIEPVKMQIREALKALGEQSCE